MEKTTRTIADLLIPAMLSISFAACQDRDSGVQIGEIRVQPSERIEIGGTAALTIQASGKDLAFLWSADRGTLSAPSAASTLYTAPSTPGLATINVQVTGEGGSVVKSTMFEIIDKPTPSQASPPISPSGAVTLSNPQDQTTVACETLAKGRYSPDVDDAIWPVVYIDNRYHPQDEGGKGPSKVNGNWVGTVRFGDCSNPQESSGRAFQLLVLTANEAANRAFENYIQEGRRNGFRGMRQLPAGVMEHVRILVTRD